MIKRFREFNESVNEYYQLLDEYPVDGDGVGNMITNIDELRRLAHLLGDRYSNYLCNITYSEYGDYKKKDCVVMSPDDYDSDNITVWIYPDEWYVVECSGDYLKCDQLKGLYKCLDDYMEGCSEDYDED